MQLSDYLSDLTGLSPSQLFSGPTPLVVLSLDGEGNHTIDTWNVTGTPKPGADQISKALADTSASKLSLATYAQSSQNDRRDGGITVAVESSKIDVSTDSVGRGLLSGLVQLAALGDKAAVYPWVNNDHSTVSLSPADVSAVGVAVGEYVQATYTVLGSVLGDIASGKITTTAQIDAASWPATSK